MKIIFRNIGLILLLVSSLFSAILTEDLEVVSPTGLHPTPYSCEMRNFMPDSKCSITIRFIENSMGVSLIREHTKGGLVQLSQPLVVPRTSLVIVKSSSGDVPEGRIIKMNVTLE
jgi:hypothetical protein